MGRSGEVRGAIAAGFLALLGAAACSSGGGATTTELDLPTLGKLPGPVLASPRVQPIYFKGFPYANDIDTFLTRLSASAYWPAVVAEYGVGALSPAVGYPTNVPLPTPLTDKNLPDLLAAALTEGAASLGPARGDTIYALFFDPATTLTVMDMTLCARGQPSAYHDEWTIGGVQVPVAIVPSCPTFPGQAALSPLEVLTLTLSHELVEAATDPLVLTHPAWAGIDREHLLWAIGLNGAEIADLCENELPLTATPADLGYPVQRIWSNASAHAGTGPCVPVPEGEVYFQAVAEQPERGDFASTTGKTYSLPVMRAGVGLDASARVTFRGGPDTPASLKAVAFEMDEDNSIALGALVPVTGKLGQAPVSVSVGVSSRTTSGVVPLLVGATSGHGDFHLWVGGINRK